MAEPIGGPDGAETRTLDESYRVARERFLAAARGAGAETTSFPHPAAGRHGEELAIDVAEFGRGDENSLLVVVSGTHGVEGYAGSALQTWWCDVEAGRRPAAVRVALVHGFNPHGFSWVRRVNEDNVDLNRNFVGWPDRPTNDGYGAIADLLVPAAWDAATQEATTGALLEEAERVGFERFQEIVSGGQYEYPTGIFYGGTGPVWSHGWLRAHFPDIVGAADRVGVIDLHTGLGPWGVGELIAHEPRGTPGYQRGTAWWGEVRSMLDGESVSAALSGDWLGVIAGLAPGAEVTGAALEFGTVDTVTVLQSLRADAWLHAHGDVTGPVGDEVRAQVRAAFADDDPDWLEALIARFGDVARQALAALSG